MVNIRTRFAPSPTGFMHIGGVRTALFACLLARQSKGSFILRLEDTDKKREVVGSDEHIINTLLTLGLNYDEGPDIGGNFGPYRQSERLDIYRKWATKMINEGRAYADPYSQEEIQEFRDIAKSNKKAFLYRNHRPENPPSWDGSQPLRFKSSPKYYKWHDEVMGNLSAGPEVIDDFIIFKSDGFPTYNFAHIIDDFEMKISHIIRGQEFISSQANYLNLYEALDISPPIFATVPHILGESGNKKLGKRDGADDVLDYLKQGYISEALINFIASMGWNDGTTQEVFTRKELIDKFNLSQVGRSGARFDQPRLLWLNGQHIRRLPLGELYKRVTDFWPENSLAIGDDRKMQILGLVQDRIKIFTDLPVLTSYFFTEPTPDWTMIDSNKQLAKLSQKDLVELLETAKNSLANSSFDATSIQQTLNQLLETTGQKPGVLFSLIRLAVSWAPFSPSLNDTLEALGQKTVLDRLNKSIQAGRRLI